MQPGWQGFRVLFLDAILGDGPVVPEPVRSPDEDPQHIALEFPAMSEKNSRKSVGEKKRKRRWRTLI